MTSDSIRSYELHPYEMLGHLSSSELHGEDFHTSLQPGTYQLCCGEHEPYDHASCPEVMHNNFDPWMLEEPSTTSLLELSKDVVMPPVYTEPLLPGHGVHEQNSAFYLGDTTVYTDHRAVTETLGAQYPVPLDWNTDLLAFNWIGEFNAYSGPPYPVAESVISSMPLIAAPDIPLPGQNQLFLGQVIAEPCPSSSAGESSTEDDSEDGSDGDSDNDAYEDLDGFENRTTLKSGDDVEKAGLMMSNWIIGGMNCYDRQEMRSFFCPLTGQPDVKGKTCNARFVRPEHCRRHVRTVHGDRKDHRCKVPMCNREFSRGDNLRDHYWTHLHRGGRLGRNDKMSLADLKEILGKSEKKLIGKFRMKMVKDQAKRQREIVKAKL